RLGIRRQGRWRGWDLRRIGLQRRQFRLRDCWHHRHRRVYRRAKRQNRGLGGVRAQDDRRAQETSANNYHEEDAGRQQQQQRQHIGDAPAPRYTERLHLHTLILLGLLVWIIFVIGQLRADAGGCLRDRLFGKRLR